MSLELGGRFVGEATRDSETDALDDSDAFEDSASDDSTLDSGFAGPVASGSDDEDRTETPRVSRPESSETVPWTSASSVGNDERKSSAAEGDGGVGLVTRFIRSNISKFAARPYRLPGYQELTARWDHTLMVLKVSPPLAFAVAVPSVMLE